MGNKEYYQVLGKAVDDGGFARQIKDTTTDDMTTLKAIVRNEAQIELDDADLRDVKAAVDALPEITRSGPGGKMRR
jgi:hypothetical protein